MSKYYVNCTMIYNGHCEVEANDWKEACEKAEESMSYDADCDFPNSGKLGLVDFSFGEATADDANIKYDNERYAFVEFYWKDDKYKTVHEDVVVISESPVIEDSYEDQHSIYRVSDYRELEKLRRYENGADFVVTNIFNYSNTL